MSSKPLRINIDEKGRYKGIDIDIMNIAKPVSGKVNIHINKHPNGKFDLQMPKKNALKLLEMKGYL